MLGPNLIVRFEGSPAPSVPWRGRGLTRVQLRCLDKHATRARASSSRGWTIRVEQDSRRSAIAPGSERTSRVVRYVYE
jgi:hypothetical protein